MGRYAVIGLAHDGMWSCATCGAVVTDRQLHDQAVHADWQEKLPPRQYDGPVPNAQYNPPPQRTED